MFQPEGKSLDVDAFVFEPCVCADYSRSRSDLLAPAGRPPPPRGHSRQVLLLCHGLSFDKVQPSRQTMSLRNLLHINGLNEYLLRSRP